MGRRFIVLFLFLGWGCNSDETPVLAPYLPEPAALGPAAKASASPTWRIWWPCEAEEDSVWTVFNGRFEFHIEGSEVTVAERRDNPSRKVSHQDHDAVVAVADGYCWLTSSFVQPNSALRIFRGPIWRDSIRRYYLTQDDDTYLINRRYVSADGEYRPPFESVWYRDFLDLHNRNEPRPEGLYELRSQYHTRSYYLPVNFSAAALDTLISIPEDDRPFLERYFVRADGGTRYEDEDSEPSSSSSGSSGTSSSGSSSGTPSSSSSGSSGTSSSGSSSGTPSSGGQPSGNQGNQGPGSQPPGTNPPIIPPPGSSSCPEGQSEDDDGVCQCPEGQSEDDDGVCQCPEGAEKIGSACVYPPCPQDQERDANGVCQWVACPSEQRRDSNGVCQWVACPSGQTRDSNGVCQCPAGKIKEGSTCREPRRYRWRVLARSRVCCYDHGEASARVYSEIRERSIEGGGCERSECYQAVVPCTGSTTASSSFCSARMAESCAANEGAQVYDCNPPIPPCVTPNCD